MGTKFYITRQGSLRGLRTRLTRSEQAAQFCSAIASNAVVYNEDASGDVGLVLGTSVAAQNLARKAHKHVVDVLCGGLTQLRRKSVTRRLIYYAEAEALLRSGWQP